MHLNFVAANQSLVLLQLAIIIEPGYPRALCNEHWFQHCVLTGLLAGVQYWCVFQCPGHITLDVHHLYHHVPLYLAHMGINLVPFVHILSMFHI